MKKTIMAVIVTLLVISMVGTVFAGQNGNEYAYDKDGVPLRDGSCKDSVVDTILSILLGDSWGPQFRAMGDCPCD